MSWELIWSQSDLDSAGPDARNTVLFEIGGVISAVGASVSHLKIGDRVVGFSSENSFPWQTTSGMLLCSTKPEASLEVSSMSTNSRPS